MILLFEIEKKSIKTKYFSKVTRVEDPDPGRASVVEVDLKEM